MLRCGVVYALQLPGCTDHNAGPKSYTCLYAGSVPKEQYSALVSTMHSIIKEQHAHKKQERATGIDGNDRSYYQRTPAFVLSAVHAALAALAAEEQQEDSQVFGEDLLHRIISRADADDVDFPPPRGGFTDVGEHSNSQARPTTWALLQSVLKVRALDLLLQDCQCDGAVLSACVSPCATGTG